MPVRDSKTKTASSFRQEVKRRDGCDRVFHAERGLGPGVATPLAWDELTASLRPERLTHGLSPNGSRP